MEDFADGKWAGGLYFRDGELRGAMIFTTTSVVDYYILYMAIHPDERVVANDEARSGNGAGKVLVAGFR